jgi:1-deoxy-D-xylulose-5-phosphate reductoisomerase
VIFTDGSVKGQLAAPDMRVPIGYALAYPDRLPSAPAGPAPQPLEALGAKPAAETLRYDFEPADPDRFPCVRLAYEALAAGGTVPAVLSAANEVAVNAFVEGRIAFGEISHIIESAMDRVERGEPTLDGFRSADRKARQTATAMIETIKTC